MHTSSMKALLLVLLGLVASAHAATLAVQLPRFVVSSSKGEQIRSDPISLVGKPATLSLGPTDTLRIAFQVVDKDEGKGVQPHQTFLRFYDEISGEEGIQPLRVAASGKVKYELNMARPPASLPPTSADSSLKVSLIIGSFVHSPLKYDLLDLTIPASQPVTPHPEEHTFHSLPAIHHTFNLEQQLPPSIISAVASVLVVSPWLVLLGLWSNISPKVPHLFSANILPFTATLAAFEGLLFWYWIDLKLGQVLLYGGVLGVVAIMTGKNALVTARDIRSSK